MPSHANKEPQVQQQQQHPMASAAAVADAGRHRCDAPAASSVRTNSKRKSTSSSSSLSSSDSELLVANNHSNSNRNGASGNGPSRKTRKKRKSTYLVRKDEMELLEKEAKVLESHVEALKQREQGGQGGILTERELLNAILHEMRRSQQLSLAVAQSAVSGFLNADQSNPLSTYVRLGNDWDQRHKTLVAMKDKKIRSAFEYVQARSQFLDPLKPHHSEERFENAQGDFCCARFDIFQFEGAESVRQVYDALLSYLHNIEISVSERLGHITVREDFDSVDNSVTNFRLLSEQCGVPVESNIVTFAKYFEDQHDGDELSSGDSTRYPCAVLTGECVDDDELYPYSPTERARRDVAVAIMLTPHMRKKRDGEGHELVVAMAQCKFHKLYKSSELELPPQTTQELRDNMCWAPVMVKTINELLRSEPPAVFPVASDLGVWVA